jgi:tripartite-type tricarboxylate transporter receptor subunit TctC
MRAIPTILACIALAAAAAHAQDAYPSRTITLVVPLSAGSQMDILARALAENLGKQANQPVVVLNREGGSMVVGTDAVVKARPDGYTIGFGPDGPLSVQAHLNPATAIKPQDLELVCQTNNTALMVVVGPQSPFQTFADLVAAARKDPGKLNYGTPGNASGMHLLAEAVAAEAGVKFNHVPFKNIGDMTVQTLNGSLDFTVTVPNTLAANGARGMRGLAVTGDTKLLNVPLLREQGLGKTSPSNAIGVYAPKGIPPQALDWLRTACKAAVESPGFTSAATRTWTPVVHADSAAYAKAVQENSRIAGELIRKLGITNQ